MSEIKKYPVTYKDKEYEIRIEEETEYDFYIDGLIKQKYVNIYEVTKENYGLFKNKTRNNYEKVYSKEISCLDGTSCFSCNKLIFKDDDKYYIKLFKRAFKEYIKPLEQEERKLALLKEWDGVINDD